MDGGGGPAARHVGPPRTLDVQQFAASRASEVQVLYNALKAQQEEGNSSLTTPRHLRRRTASHNRRPPFRWKNHAAETGKTKKNEKKRKDKSSLESSYLVQGNAGTPAEDESSRKRKPGKQILSRRVRRRIELQGLREGTVSCMRDGTRRLATHVWHAKRFPMTKTWGYCLPQGLPGRGRGSKAVFKWVKEAAVLHDASYIGLIELQGSEDGIQRILSQTLETPTGPSASGSSVKEEEMHGLFYGNAVLHNVGKAPREAIAPVTILWRPSSSQGTETSELSTMGEGAKEERQLWIWVHPSAFDDALLALSTACERQDLDGRQGSVKCRSRRGELARLDILGKGALSVLQKVLRPIPRKLAHPASSNEIARVSGREHVNTDMTATMSPNVSQPLSARIFAKADCLPAAAVLALDVYDPRDTPRSFYSGTEAKFSESVQDGVKHNILPGDSPSTSSHPVDEETAFQERKPVVDFVEDTGLTHREKLLEKGLSEEVSDSPYLWSPQTERKLAALSQKAFSGKRNRRRKAYFTGVDTDFLHSNLGEGTLDSRGACPVLLLKRAHSRASASGWSIIMPIAWVQAFWVPLVFAGGHVIGLRERHWLATDAGLPYFPHDFPDCPGHAQHLAIEKAAFNSANQARPPSKRSPCFTISPLQRSIMYAHRDSMLDSFGGTAAPAVASQLIDEEHGEQFVEGKCIMLAGATPRFTDLNGDTAMTEASNSIVREPSPLVGLIFASELRNGDGNAVTNAPVLPAGCQNVHGENSPNFKGPPAEDSASFMESLPNTISSLEVASHGVDGATLPEFANPEADTAMTGTRTIVSGSLVSPAASQTTEGFGIPDLTVPLGYNALNEDSSLHDRFQSLPVHSVNGEENTEFANPDRDFPTAGTDALVTSAQELAAPCQLVVGPFIAEFSNLEGNTGQIVQTVDGVSVPEPLGDNVASEFESLPDIIPPLPGASESADGTDVPESTHLDGDSEMVRTDTEVARLPFSEMAYETAEGVSVQELTNPEGDYVTILDCIPQYGLNSSSVASQLEQPEFVAHESERINSGKSSLGDTACAALEMIGPRPTECRKVILEVVGNVTDSFIRDHSPKPLPSSPVYHTVLGLNSNIKSTTGISKISIFVARTVGALMDFFRGNGWQDALLLCPGLTSSRNVRNGLRKGTLEWRASHKLVESSVCPGNSKMHAMVEGRGKGCYARVLILVPRRGVMKENGILCSPTKEDFDAFLSRSQHWQGVEASWLNPQAKELKKKGKWKEKRKRKHHRDAVNSATLGSNTKAEDASKGTMHLDGGYEDCCTREAIGCITSTGPQGSSWSGVGICEVSSLSKLRAMQWQDQRWWNRKEILLLAGNRLSPILRPVLVSIVLETGPEQDIMW